MTSITFKESSYDRGKDEFKEKAIKLWEFNKEAEQYLNYIEYRYPDYFESLRTGQARFPQRLYNKVYGKAYRA